MQHVVVATAGHIDHGKTELVRALTGIDTDRLPEEKARGITIDLGFAHLDLGGRRLAFIDVPGHERFVKNMLAGVGGIDLALLVVAADESVMPQTREHVAILDLLQVRRALVALTKRDLVDAETAELARLEVAELVAATTLAGAPIVAVSARTGAGLDELRAALAAIVAGIAPRAAEGPFRLHVDRAFSIKGFGAVVTGTVVAGRVAVGDEVELSPPGKLAKVRGIEVHGSEAQAALAGTRAALNLSGVELDEVGRGQQLLSPGIFTPAALVDVRLELLPGASPLKDLARVRFHLGAGEFLARVRLLDAPGRRLAGGAHAHAQLRLERPLVVWPGDRFVVRSYSPMATIGGGSVLEAAERKHRGKAERAVSRLVALEGAAPPERLRQWVEAAGRRGITAAELAAKSGRFAAAVEAALAGPGGGVVTVAAAGPRYFALAAWREREELVLAELARFHAANPLRPGMSREELRARLLGGDAASARQLLDGLAAAGAIRYEGEMLALGSHRVALKDDQSALKEAIEKAFRGAGLNPPAMKDVLAGLGPQGKGGEALVPLLLREGKLVLLPGGMHIHVEAVAGLKQKLAALGAKPFSVPEFKELTGTTRKHAIPLLEHLDAVRFTRRQGDLRVVVG